MSRQPERWGRATHHEQVRGRPTEVYVDRSRSLAELRRSARPSDRAFLVHGARRVLHADVGTAVVAVADRLRAANVQAGDRVALLGSNSIEWILGFWAASEIGAIPVLCNAWWSAAEVAYGLGLTTPAVVIADGRRRRLLPSDAVVIAAEDLATVVDGAIAGAAAADSQPFAVDEDDPAFVLFTSGTTGPPKGAVLSHRGVIANQQNLLNITQRLPTDPAPPAPATTLLSVPLFHLGGLNSMITTLLTGGTFVFLEGRFDAGEVLDLIQRERITSWSAVPTMVRRVLDHPGVATADLSSLRNVGAGGAPVTNELRARAAKALPNLKGGLTVAYGLTEASGTVSSSTATEQARRPGSCGTPLPTVEVRIDGPGAGEPGEILVRGATVMLGYWGEEQDHVDGEGWLHTGDVGRLDDDGHLYVVDRDKDIIIRGGENIASANVEAALLTSPAVAEAAVFGLPDDDLGEIVAAVIVVRPGWTITDGELDTHARALLAHFEVPTRWWLRDEALPVSTAGKVAKRALKAEWIERSERVDA